MVQIKAIYDGDKKCTMTHLEGTTLRTDAPKDIGGDASAFSPTDLVAAALASCVLTTMAMWGERHGINLAGSSAQVGKEMSQNPRRIGHLPLTVFLPASIPEEIRPQLEKIGHACPVHASLHPDVDAVIEYRYD